MQNLTTKSQLRYGTIKNYHLELEEDIQGLLLENKQLKETVEFNRQAIQVLQAQVLDLYKNSFSSKPFKTKKVKSVIEKPILQVDKNTGDFINKWPGGAIQVQRELGLNAAAIAEVLYGRTKSSGGFRWVLV